MSDPFGFPTFRVYSVTESARRVAADLAVQVVSYAVFRLDEEGDEQWRVLRVDDALLAALGLGRRTPRRGPTVAQALKTMFEGLDDFHWAMDTTSDASDEGELPGMETMRVPRAWLAGYQSGPRIFFDRTGTLRAFAIGAGAALPARRASVYPRLECAEGTEVSAEQTVEFELRIEAKPPGGVVQRLDLEFPEGAATLDLHATVSSDDFVRPDGAAWSATFTIDRQLAARPASWTFQVRAHGERDRYSLTIQFLALNRVVGALEATLVRRQSGLPAKIEHRGLRLPAVPGAPLAVAVSSDAQSICAFECFRKGKSWARSEPAPFAGEGFFGSLASAQTLRSLREVGLGLSTELPPAVLAFFGIPEDEGQAMLIASVGRVAPFEAARSRLAVAQSFLGIERPILRWTSLEMPDVERIDVGPMACIRPEYPEKPLPSARDEEQYLVGRFGSARVTRVATEEQLEALLDRADVRLLHFAGHADGAPAELTLEGRVKVRATRFDPARPLVKEGHPFFFLNGCRAGWGSETTAAMVGNLVKALLLYEFSGVVAPTIRVDSGAALIAARTFYDAVATRTAVEAVQDVRSLALAADTPDGLRSSYLSYVAFAPAQLRLAL